MVWFQLEEDLGALFDSEVFELDQVRGWSGLLSNPRIDIEVKILPPAVAFLGILGNFTP